MKQIKKISIKCQLIPFSFSSFLLKHSLNKYLFGAMCQASQLCQVLSKYVIRMIVFTFYISLIIIMSMVTACMSIHKLSFLHFDISSEPQSKCLNWACSNCCLHLGLQKRKPKKDKCPELHESGQGRMKIQVS